MKNKLLPFVALALGVFSFGEIRSQTTIELSDFPTQGSSFRSTRNIVTNSTNYKTPSEGENKVWNYTGFESSGNLPPNMGVTSDNDFSLSHHYWRTYGVFQNFRIVSDFHYGLDQEGYFRYAKQQYDTTFSLQSLTGNPSDEINFPDAKIMFDGKANVVRFPLSYGASWSDTTILRTPYVLTAQAFGLNKVPGFHQLTMIYNREVVGEGKVVMDDDNGNPSVEMNALLVNSRLVHIDSFYLGGSPAPAQLLAAFGASQGARSEYLSYDFYREGYGDYLLHIEADFMEPDKDLYYMSFNNDAIVPNTASMPNLLTSDIQLYPNPMHNGQRLQLNSQLQDAKVARFVLLSVDGRKVVDQLIEFDHGIENNDMPIPSYLVPGIYTCQLYDAHAQLIYVNKLMVIE